MERVQEVTDAAVKHRIGELAETPMDVVKPAMT
jgi:hypothetical protein